MRQLADSVPDLTIAKLKVQKVKEANETSWIYYLGVVYEQAERFKQAIATYKEYLAKEQNPIVADRLSDCYSSLGQYEKALEYCNQAISLDSTKNEYLLNKALIEDNAGMYDKAISDMTAYIALEPDYFFGYYRRGWIKDKMKDYDGAIEDYTMAITLEPEYAYAFMCRGNLYRIKREMDKAMADFKETVRLDSIPEEVDCAHYAYYYLGEKEKAIEVMNAILKKGNKGDYYDAACLYSIMGEKEKALAYLRTALEKGYRRFAHFERDRDLDNIRNTEEYKALINEYKEKYLEELAEEQNADLSEYINKVEEIPFTKEGGVCKVNVPSTTCLYTSSSILELLMFPYHP